MTPVISILIAHKKERENDKALKIALDTIVDNTDVDYEVFVRAVTEYQDCYAVYNDMAQYARGEWLVFHNSDTFVAPRWASEMVKIAAPDAIVGCVLVECGAIGTARQNVNLDLGRTPEMFNRAGFEQWAAAQYPNTFMNPGYGDTAADKAGVWYFPSLIGKQAFIDSGMFDTEQGWPFPNDINYWNRWAADGKRLIKAPAYIYHLQAYSVKENQEKRVTQQTQTVPQIAVPQQAGGADINMLFGRR